jgi:hypothetical protein
MAIDERSSMPLVVVIVAIAAAATAAAIGASVASRRFGARVASEVEHLWRDTPPAVPLDRDALRALPAPVRRYLTAAIRGRDTAVRTLRLRHGGTFRTKLDGPWLPIRGEQYFATDPPAFIWWGRVRMAPGLWVDARDRSVGGAGRMLVKVESTFTIADARGSELDQGALLRTLAEMSWLPTAFLDRRYVSWTPVDATHARAILHVAGREVSGVFAFGEDGLPRTFEAERYRDVGNGRSALTPFVGESSDYREVEGLIVPHRMVASWVVDSQPAPYVRFEVDAVEYDATAPFS